MANVTVPTPLAAAGAGLCLLAGYLLGVVSGADDASDDTATVISFDGRTDRLCLEGEALAEQPQADDGRLCGEWRPVSGGRDPQEGEEVRFATLTSDPGDEGDVTTLIYGEVVR